MDSVQLQGDVAAGRLHSTEAIGPEGETTQRFSTRIPAIGDKILLRQAEQRALAVIREHRVELVRLITALEEQETLHHVQIEQCLGPAPRSKPLFTGSG